MPQRLMRLNGGEVKVDYEFDRGCKGSYCNPGYPASVTIEEIHFRDVNVMQIISADDFMELEDTLLQKILDEGRDEKQAYDEARAEALEDERRGL